MKMIAICCVISACLNHAKLLSFLVLASIRTTTSFPILVVQGRSSLRYLHGCSGKKAFGSLLTLQRNCGPATWRHAWCWLVRQTTITEVPSRRSSSSVGLVQELSSGGAIATT